MKRTYYTLDQTKTPVENIISILKYFVPITEITVAKMAGTLIQGDHVFINGVHITPYTAKTSYDEETIDINKFAKLKTRVEIPRYYARRRQSNKKVWSVPVENSRICISTVEYNYKTLSKMYSEAKVTCDERAAADQADRKELEDLITTNNLSGCRTSVSRDGEGFSIWVSRLSKEQIEKLAPHIITVVKTL